MAPASKPNPQIVKDEIVEHIRRESLAIYHVEPEMWPEERSVWWDTNRVPDYKKFIAAAKSAGAKMILYYDQDLSEGTIADAEDALEVAVLEPEVGGPSVAPRGEPPAPEGREQERALHAVGAGPVPRTPLAPDSPSRALPSPRSL